MSTADSFSTEFWYHGPAVRSCSWIVAIATLVGLSGCPADDDMPSDTRLIPPGDVDYTQLETPELIDECFNDDGCEHSCVHSCVPLDDGPVTCPVIPIPTPERLTTASCVCEASVCAWWDPPP